MNSVGLNGAAYINELRKHRGPVAACSVDSSLVGTGDVHFQPSVIDFMSKTIF